MMTTNAPVPQKPRSSGNEIPEVIARRAALPVPPPACLSAWTRCALLPGPDAIVPASPRSRRPRDTRPALSRARGQPRDSTRCASVWSPGPHVICGFSQERAPLPRPVAPATGRRIALACRGRCASCSGSARVRQHRGAYFCAAPPF